MKEIFYCSIKLIAHKILSCHDINGRVGRLDFKVGLSFRVLGLKVLLTVNGVKTASFA